MRRSLSLVEFLVFNESLELFHKHVLPYGSFADVKSSTLGWPTELNRVSQGPTLLVNVLYFSDVATCRQGERKAIEVCDLGCNMIFGWLDKLLLVSTTKAFSTFREAHRWAKDLLGDVNFRIVAGKKSPYSWRWPAESPNSRSPWVFSFFVHSEDLKASFHHGISLLKLTRRGWRLWEREPGIRTESAPLKLNKCYLLTRSPLRLSVAVGYRQAEKCKETIRRARKWSLDLRLLPT